MKSLLKGISLTSENPEATATFYRTVAGLMLEQIGDVNGFRYWKVDQDGMQLAIHDAKAFAVYTFPARSDSNVTHLYFQIQNHEQFLLHLANLNLTPNAIDAVVVTVTDPDGRKVMFGTA